MSEIRHILIATDGSDTSLKAAAFGGDMARALDTSVSLIMVHNEQSVIPEAWKAVGLEFKDGSALSTDDIRGQIEADALAGDLAQSVSALGEVPTAPDLVNLWGHAADEICDYAAQHDVDMIVIGSHGRSGIKEALLGSVSHSVANRATCAVTIVR